MLASHCLLPVPRRHLAVTVCSFWLRPSRLGLAVRVGSWPCSSSPAARARRRKPGGTGWCWSTSSKRTPRTVRATRGTAPRSASRASSPASRANASNSMASRTMSIAARHWPTWARRLRSSAGSTRPIVRTSTPTCSATTTTAGTGLWWSRTQTTRIVSPPLTGRGRSNGSARARSRSRPASGSTWRWSRRRPSYGCTSMVSPWRSSRTTRRCSLRR